MKGKIMTEKESIAFMESLKKSGIVPGLNSIRMLCKKLGDPQDKLQFIHIAGTNGKGSVLAYLSTIYRKAGYCVGTFSSPAVFSYYETIRVNGRNITKQAYASGMERIREAICSMQEEGLPSPTAFEAEVALSLLYFADKQCDIVIMEAGMGGREDATNLITKTLAAVIMPIGMDHMQYLGKTISQIAEHKAGIIKRQCVTVSAIQEKEAEEKIRSEAARKESRCVFAGEAVKIKYGLKRQKFTYKDASGSLHKEMEISVPGACQIENASVAIEVVTALSDRLPVKEQDMRRGLSDTLWPGRFEILKEKPYFIIDGAHNEAAAKKLMQSVRTYFSNKRIIYIMGMLKDKDYEKTAAITYREADQIITVTPPENPRALSALDLAAAVSAYHPRVTSAGSVEEAVEMAYLLAGKEDVILCFGSLSFLNRVKKILKNR
ncbi:MAG: bifunctional folylpolyglutamate synthase/dihydrofolate synthase [Lachnospiraceae bacterium]